MSFGACMDQETADVLLSELPTASTVFFHDTDRTVGTWMDAFVYDSEQNELAHFRRNSNDALICVLFDEADNKLAAHTDKAFLDLP